jgi:hypothetical protein
MYKSSVKAVSSFEKTFAGVYKFALSHNPEDRNPYLYRRDNLKSHIL